MREGLTSEAVFLRPAQPCDFEPLSRLRSDREIQARLLGHPEVRSVDDTEQWVERRSNDPHGAFWVIDDGAGVCLGFVQLTGRHGLDRHAHFGIALLPEAQGRGAGIQAMHRLFDMARSTQLRKLMCEVRADNEGARALYRKLGFRDVGTLNAHYDDGQGLWDVVVMERMLEQPA